MANESQRGNLWNTQLWNDIDRSIMADVGRVRVAQKIFPAQQTRERPIPS